MCEITICVCIFERKAWVELTEKRGWFEGESESGIKRKRRRESGRVSALMSG